MKPDDRYQRLARVLVNYSVALERGDHLLIDVMDTPDEFAIELLRQARALGAIPLIEVRHSRITREVLRETQADHATLVRAVELHRIKRMQAYIAVRGSFNANEQADVPGDRLALYSRRMRPVLDYRVKHTRWVVLRWPTPSMAQAAGLSTEAFEEFFFRVCALDYRKMARAMQPLEQRLRRTDRVQLKGPGTDLTFSLKGIGAQGCSGRRNLPDGEAFSCPVKRSVNGVIQFNTPSVYAGTRFENVRLEFRDGRVVQATSSQTRRMNEILDTDAGARYVGEFSLGFNPFILQPLCDTLFDEKIAGSLHLTPGQAYEEADNGNRSAVHWDLVLIQRPEYGGGEVWFDGELVRKDGRFVAKDLRRLNPEHLK